MNQLHCALQFLTRLPLPPLRDFQPDAISRAAKYFPLVGHLVGAVSASVLLLAAQIWSGAVPALLAIGVGMLLTGALHEDGLADTADGFGGGRTREQRLAIMKDSRIGTYGMLALGLGIALRVAALATMPPSLAALSLVVAHGAGRAIAVLAMATTEYAGAIDAAKIAPSNVRIGEASFALAWGLLPLLLLSWPAPIFALLLIASACGLLLWRAQRAIGGTTGDVLGAVEQLAEIAVLLAGASLVVA
ncbi:adenosylcobinamide-GDP ribazoletransferase [Roseiterribacter gracilis]|uniref:Adenosylcobinamide-GDP ribazoletransferase n=1 Tax=Roseiterribacter gracilis TaxID=2812848 RepID=A0A8S8X9E3_9PROT|nr:adenosylcobinamide-GDP ribazoletransferase [Rhodospirillales bacterium TMPK1]